jgi:hypothetical protein
VVTIIEAAGPYSDVEVSLVAEAAVTPVSKGPNANNSAKKQR